jgi:hypothetical protein
VDAHHEHVGAAAEDLGGAVARVHVPVEHEHPRGAELGDRRRGGDGDVVEEAESHRLRAFGVVPGRPHAAEAHLRIAPRQRVDHRARAPGGVQGGAERGFADERVGIDRPASRFAQLADAAHVLG